MKQLLLCLSFLSITAFASAQPTQKRTGEDQGIYERRLSQEREATFNKQYDSRPNTPSKTQSNSKYFENKIDEQRRKAAQKEADALDDKAAGERALLRAEERNREISESNERSFKEREMKERDRLAAIKNKANDESVYGPLRSQYAAYPFFTEEDANCIAYYSLFGNGTPRPEAAEIQKYPTYYQEYKKIAETGSFDQVLGAIMKFTRLTEKTAFALENLGKRFPAKQQQLDDSMLKIWKKALHRPAFSDATVMHRFAKRLNIDELNSLQYSYWKESILDSLRPAMTRLYFGRDTPDSQKLGPLCYQWFELAPTSELFDWKNSFILIFALRALTPEQQMAIAQNRKVSPVFLTSAWGGKEEYDKVKNYIGFKETYPGYTKKSKNTPNERWKTFAELGDADAMELYAYAIYYGYTNEKKSTHLEWKNRSAEARKKNGY